jgi:hypothetical protein
VELMELFHEELMGRLPLHDNIKRTRLGLERQGGEWTGGTERGGRGRRGSDYKGG